MTRPLGATEAFWEADNGDVRIVVRVTPGASRTAAGGRYDASGEIALRVRVTPRAVDGKANQAVLEVVAAAFGVRSRDVELVRGPTARTKVLSVDGDEAALRARLNELLNA